jgi:hypothetical protein
MVAQILKTNKNLLSTNEKGAPLPLSIMKGALGPVSVAQAPLISIKRRQNVDFKKGVLLLP